VSTKKLLVAHGAVATIKAIPSRELSVIYIELPIEHHVAATNLLFNQNALVSLSRLPAGTPFGVLDPAEPAVTAQPLPDAPAGEQTEDLTVVHGCVSGVRAVPSRQVTVITVDLPEDAHVAATRMLYGASVLAIPAALGPDTPFGLVQGAGKGAVHEQNRRSAHLRAPAPCTAGGSGFAALSRARVSGLIHLPQQMNIVKWLGARCTEKGFQDFLGVRNEAQAKERVCQICGVESRKDIPGVPRARELFMSQIYRPFSQQPEDAAR